MTRPGILQLHLPSMADTDFMIGKASLLACRHGQHSTIHQPLSRRRSRRAYHRTLQHCYTPPSFSQGAWGVDNGRKTPQKRTHTHPNRSSLGAWDFQTAGPYLDLYPYATVVSPSSFPHYSSHILPTSVTSTTDLWINSRPRRLQSCQCVVATPWTEALGEEALVAFDQSAFFLDNNSGLRFHVPWALVSHDKKARKRGNQV
ncbi:uncharacterized protein B0T23DRAFT_128475 [Neurospora hispaniola]|uniref:Uncharacterized protein n=1 Tax=Neurospora hispaniola TaxID=588809 RepID=A0AAJ0IAU5_9PEZI|nr:hypothetical protein B0T23DRAFT_128475 [Neurospora hispaniola]